MTLSFDNPPSLLRHDDGQRQLILRLARVDDAEAVVEAAQESLAALREFMPWPHFPQTVEVQRKRLAGLEEGHGTGGDIVFHLFEEEGGPFVGCIGLHRRALNPRAFEVGYWVRTSAAGRGIATLAARCAVVLGLEYFACQRIQCVYNEANAASGRVVKNVGFAEEGRLRLFEDQPTDEMRSNGYKAQPMAVMNALFSEDRERLDWYPGVRSALTVLDRNGSVALPVETLGRSSVDRKV
ncbi:MAG TPA: GNAT family N-acetyltransferase [Planctomycetota bacterium]|jgi:RimJ/RimL family protein N-acetyltransferase|nr:hypothetical protein [Planctomycetaceae bacterium]HJM56641.1 GNAT family N-acetyltransferase [Planctomycetota bacterium]